MAELTQSAYLAEDFERERERIDALIWGATGITEGESVLLCGLPADISVPRRIVELGARLTIIESRTKAISRAEELGYTVTRGSTSVIPARDNAFDVALAFNYLHEVDPFFHQQIVSELSRVGRRLAIVELATPTDLLGRRIAALYSRAKRELGQFEYYQSLDYWKKLVSMTKAEVSQAVFTFRKVPGPEFLQDTIDFLLDTMEREEAPMEYMDELRDIADESGAKLLPQGRYVLVGATAGELPKRNPTALGKLDRAASDANAERAVPAAPAVEPPAPAIAPAAAAAAAYAASAALPPGEPAAAPPPEAAQGTPPPATPAEPIRSAVEPPPPIDAPQPVAEYVPEPPPPPKVPRYAEVDQEDGIPAPPSLSGFADEPPPAEFGIRFDEALAPVREPPGFGIPQIPPVDGPGTSWQWEPPEAHDDEGK